MANIGVKIVLVLLCLAFAATANYIISIAEANGFMFREIVR